MFTSKSPWPASNWEITTGTGFAAVDRSLFDNRTFSWSQLKHVINMMRCASTEQELADVKKTLDNKPAVDLYAEMKKEQAANRRTEMISLSIQDAVLPLNLLVATLEVCLDAITHVDPNDTPCICFLLQDHKYDEMQDLFAMIDINGPKSRDTFTINNILLHCQLFGNQLTGY